LLVTVALSVAVVGCNRPKAATHNRTIRVALSKDPIAWLPVRLPQKLGFYEQEDLTVQVSEVAGLSKGMEALLAGSVDVAAETASGVIQLAAEGRPVQSFILVSSRPQFALVVSPVASGRIHDISDLPGHRVGVTSLGSPAHWFLNYLLVSHRLAPESVSTVGIGTAGTSVSAVEHGQVDAAVLVSNAISMLTRHHPQLKILADARTQEGLRRSLGADSFPGGVLVAQQSWLRENTEVAQRFVSAMQKATAWMTAHSPEDIRLQISEAERMPDADADREAIRNFQEAMSRDGRMPEGGPEMVRKVLAVSDKKFSTAHLDMATIFTNAFVSGQ
jgi:NitT/TauT family transport system substrate-binding protein